MGINTRRVKSLNNSCEMCDVSVVKLYEQNDERLVPNFRIISADNPKLIPVFFHLHAQFLFLDLITICLLHMYHLTELKLIKVRHSTNVHFFLALLLMIKNYDISFKILRVIWGIKRKKKCLLWKSPGTNLYTKSWRVWSSLQTQKRS